MKNCLTLNSRLDKSGRECGGPVLPHSFFDRKTPEVARDLIGRELVRNYKGTLLRARIVETEAYLEKDDPAAHCAGGPTPRSKVMWDEPGTIYVYFIYGNYFMLNFVTEPKGTAGAVLIRAVEPVEGIEKMAFNRGVDAAKATRKRIVNLTNGPAKLVMALGVNGKLNGKLLGLPELAVCEGNPVRESQVITTTRIGISVATDLPLRFYERDNPFVSKK